MLDKSVLIRGMPLPLCSRPAGGLVSAQVTSLYIPGLLATRLWRQRSKKRPLGLVCGITEMAFRETAGVLQISFPTEWGKVRKTGQQLGHHRVCIKQHAPVIKRCGWYQGPTAKLLPWSLIAIWAAGGSSCPELCQGSQARLPILETFFKGGQVESRKSLLGQGEGQRVLHIGVQRELPGYGRQQSLTSRAPNITMSEQTYMLKSGFSGYRVLTTFHNFLLTKVICFFWGGDGFKLLFKSKYLFSVDFFLESLRLLNQKEKFTYTIMT